jgi:hypothetical protein
MLKEKTSLEQQLEELKVLSGIYKPYQMEDSAQENISYTGTEKSKYQKKHKIEPGTKEWFKLWFARPKLTGENPYEDK